MKVSSLFPQIKTDNKVQKGRKSDEAGPLTSAGPPVGADTVQLSAASMDVQKMKEVLQETPLVRQERVQELKGRIDRGEYKIDPYKVADKMLISLLSEKDLTD